MTTRAGKVTLEVACPHCTPIHGCMDLDARAVHLTVRNNGGQNTYEFICPRCLMDVVKEADQVITTMMLGRVPHTVVDVPDEVVDPVKNGPALGYDDLLDFVEALNQDGWTVPLERNRERQGQRVGCVPFVGRERA